MDTEPVMIRPLAVPAGLDSRGAADFIASARLANLVARLVWGNNDHRCGPADQLEQARGADQETRLWTAQQGSCLVGRAGLSLPLADNLHLAEVTVMVHPACRRQGTGRRLLRTAEDAARAAGRTVLLSWSGQPAGPGPDGTETVRARSGTGALPAGTPAVAFARACGYELEQVERFSVLDLAAGTGQVPVLAEAAAAKAGTRYRLAGWEDRCPDEYLAGYARLRRRMSMEVPLGGIDYRPEAWDGTRVRRAEEELARRGGRMLAAAVLDLPGGELAGYTFAQCFREKPDVAYQEDTLVLPAHRGRGLGMLLKAGNLLRIRRRWPEARRLYTWNAAENSPILAINTALGFTLAGYEAGWQKRLAPDRDAGGPAAGSQPLPAAPGPAYPVR